MDSVAISYDLKFPSSTITKAAGTTAYAALDAISGSDDGHFTFGENSTVNTSQDDGVTLPGDNTGFILGAQLFTNSNPTTQLNGRILLFHQDIADIADNSPFTSTDAELVTRIGFIDFLTPDWESGDPAADAAGNSVCIGSRGGLTEFSLPFKSDGKGRIFGQLIALGSFTPITAQEFTAVLQVSRNVT